jgi:hypothetical protein
MAVVLLVLVLAGVPVVSGYLTSNVDNSDNVRDRSCYCHGAEQSDDVDIQVNAPSQVAYTPNNRSVVVEIGILGEPSNITGFGLLLNASEDATGVRWENKIGPATGGIPAGSQQLKVNGTVMYSTRPILEDWFNVSFIPGQIDQHIELSIIGMRSNENFNETGDNWRVLRNIDIEVKKERLMNLTVVVSNDNEIAVSEILVDFYIDDEFIGNGTVDHIPASGKGNATVAWDVTYQKDGKYSMRAVIDPEGDITETDRDNNEITRSIWLGGPPEEPDLTPLYVGAGAGIAVAVVGGAFMLYRRRLYKF